jgi:mono/diheme cytochrome c family protein
LPEFIEGKVQRASRLEEGAMNHTIRLMICAALMALAACAAPAPSPAAATSAVEPSQAALAEDGRAIAETQCAACHAIADYGDSPVPEAPPFRTVLSRYSAEVLEQELIEGIRVAHPMPDFQFNPQGADALIAYLRSIQTRETGAR